MNKQTFCFLGDSITEGVGVQIGERYCDLIGERLGVNTFSYGVSGANSLDLLEQIERMHWMNRSVDAIFVLIGTNDFYYNVPIGEFFYEFTQEFPVLYDENGNVLKTQNRRKRHFCYDKTLFCGRLNLVFAKLREYYPITPIVILTLVHRGYAFFDGDNEPRRSYFKCHRFVL